MLTTASAKDGLLGHTTGRQWLTEAKALLPN